MSFRNYNWATISWSIITAFALILLPACATRPRPAKIETVEVLVEVPVPCIKETDIPKPPERLGKTPYPKDSFTRERLMAAQIIDQGVYIDTVQPLLRACSAPLEEPSK